MPTIRTRPPAPRTPHPGETPDTLWGPRSSPHTPKKTRQNMETWLKSPGDPPHHTGARPPGAAYLGDGGTQQVPPMGQRLLTCWGPGSPCDPATFSTVCFWNLPLEQAALSSPSRKRKTSLRSHQSHRHPILNPLVASHWHAAAGLGARYGRRA